MKSTDINLDLPEGATPIDWGGTGLDGAGDLRGAYIRALWASMVLLHGFIKKTRKTPKADLEIAKARRNEVEE